MFRTTSCADVEFVGGPLDGYSQDLDLPAQVFVGIDMSTRVGRRNWLRRWVERWFVSSSRSPHVAVYELEEEGGHYRYRHVGVQRVSTCRLPRVRVRS